MRELQLTITTEGIKTAVEIDESDLDRPVSAVVAEVVAPAVAASQPLQAAALRELMNNPKASVNVKQQDASGQVTEKFMTRNQPLRDLIEEKATAIALEVERAADGG